jgi:ABC-type polysaccharide/polyol phosphate export permease
MVSAIEGFRWSLLGGALPDISAILVSGAVTTVFLLLGLIYFSRYEKSYVDYL